MLTPGNGAPTAVPGVTPGAGGVMIGGGSDAAAADTGARHIPASATITAMDDPAGRRHLPAGLAGLAEAPARPLFQNDRIVHAPSRQKRWTDARAWHVRTSARSVIRARTGHDHAHPQVLAIQVRPMLRVCEHACTWLAAEVGQSSYAPVVRVNEIRS